MIGCGALQRVATNRNTPRCCHLQGRQTKRGRSKDVPQQAAEAPAAAEPAPGSGSNDRLEHAAQRKRQLQEEVETARIFAAHFSKVAAAKKQLLEAAAAQVQVLKVRGSPGSGAGGGACGAWHAAVPPNLFAGSQPAAGICMKLWWHPALHGAAPHARSRPHTLAALLAPPCLPPPAPAV